MTDEQRILTDDLDAIDTGELGHQLTRMMQHRQGWGLWEIKANGRVVRFEIRRTDD